MAARHFLEASVLSCTDEKAGTESTTSDDQGHIFLVYAVGYNDGSEVAVNADPHNFSECRPFRLGGVEMVVIVIVIIALVGFANRRGPW